MDYSYDFNEVMGYNEPGEIDLPDNDIHPH